jgi:hypothetical protein
LIGHLLLVARNLRDRAGEGLQCAQVGSRARLLALVDAFEKAGVYQIEPFVALRPPDRERIVIFSDDQIVNRIRVLADAADAAENDLRRVIEQNNCGPFAGTLGTTNDWMTPLLGAGRG